jgi:predicted transposase YbfD/YdcC
MELSKDTLTLVKNFAGINGSLMLKAGNKLTTISEGKNIMAEVTVTEKFDKEVGIFNLPELLGIIQMMGDPEIKLEDKFMTLSEGKSKLRYVYADNAILTYPTKDIKMPSEDITFNIDAAQLMQIQKAAAALGVQDVAVVGDGKSLVIQVTDKKNGDGNQYTIDLNTDTDKVFTVYFKIENFKHIPDDYEVTISTKNISKFVGSTVGATYYVAVEQDSEWENV